MREDGVVWYFLLYLRHAVRPVGDHAEVGHDLLSSYADRLSRIQGVRRDGEEPLDRLFPVFHELRTGWFRGSRFGLFRVAPWYDLLPFHLKQTSDANPSVDSGGSSRPPIR